MQKHTLVVNSNMHFLQQGIDLLSDISDELYTKNNTRYSKSGIGRHFRHIIEHYFSLLHSNGSLIDYDARERNQRLENDRSYMIENLLQVKKALQEFIEHPEKLDQLVEVRSNEGIGQEHSPVAQTSIRRELQFLISHTVHHYALIGLILQTLGYTPDEQFGVAPSTLRYEMEKRSIQTAS